MTATFDAKLASMSDDTTRKIDALTVLCRHLVDAFEVILNDEGTGGIKGSTAAQRIEPSLAQAKLALSELCR
jgi:hypothetical protein